MRWQRNAGRLRWPAASTVISFAGARLAPRSVAGKIIAVGFLTTATALLIAGTSLLAADILHDRRSWGDGLKMAAEILARATAPALSFQDKEAAERDLSALAARPYISAAALYDAGGQIYASYVRPGKAAPPPRLPTVPGELQFQGSRAEVITPVVHNGERLGSVYLRARYDVLGPAAAYASILGVVMLAGLLISLLTLGWLQRTITQPLHAIAGVARQIVDAGEYTLRASKTTDDEFGLLVDAFNRMLSEMQMRTNALVESNTALHQAIQVRQAAEQALREADRRKDEFLATLAHELRNPLAPIRSAVSILEAANADDRQRHWGRQVIARQVHHMSLLLDDLLDISRITSGKFELKKEFVDLKSICEVAVESAHPLIAARHHVLEVDLPAAPVTLEADPLRLAQVISNLLTNASKYTDPRGRIKLTASVTQEGLTLSVVDNGIGLSPDYIPRLFTIFSQVDSGAGRTQGGLGIGLALVKGLVTLHGGTIEAHSEGLGLGSEFVVRLPSKVLSRNPTPTVAGPPPAPAMAGTCAKVLVVDDNRDGAQSLSLALRLRGYTVLTAYSAQQALEVAAREHPQALVLDIGMPGMNGYDAARLVRREAWGRHVVLIALTGWGQERDRACARDAGFDEHLTKPADVDHLQRVLTDLLTAQRTAAESRLHLTVRA